MTPSINSTAEVAHWDQTWAAAAPRAIDPDAFLAAAGPVYRAFLAAVGEVAGRRVLDLGCGAGDLSVLLAKQGADVTAADTSAQAIAATAALASHNGVADRVRPHHGDLQALIPGHQFDLIVGVFVLHHLDPFDQACRDLDRLLCPAGRGVFLENNAANPVLMLARRLLAGRYGIPKYGDASEHPFQPAELAALRGTFGHADADFPQMIFFRILNTYIFRHSPRARLASRLNDRLDDLLFRTAPFARKYSYQQIVTFHR